MEFERVKPTKASSFVGEQILNAIKTGALPMVEKLPSEAQLAEKIGSQPPDGKGEPSVRLGCRGADPVPPRQRQLRLQSGPVG